MNYNLTKISYPSSDGKNTIYAEIYTPKSETAKGVVQLAHGMTDYTARYEELADYLTGEGYVFAGNHHLGHGESVAREEDFGYFAEEGGLDLVIEDLYLMNKILRETFPALPVIMMGHSMGSFLARLYAVRHPHTIRGLIIHGTGGKNPLVGLGILVARIVKKIYGGHHHSALIQSLAFGNYNKRFPKEEGSEAWLTRDVATVASRPSDKFTSFTFTTAGYIDLFLALRESNSKAWYKEYPKDMPTLVISGDMDPVGNYGKGPVEVYEGLIVGGVGNIELKLYPEARHELFNEINRGEVFSDLVEWLGGAIR